MDLNQQKPYTTDQIKKEKPAIPKTLNNEVMGFIAGSHNGGINKVVLSKEVMAGERHRNLAVKVKIRTLTPKTAAYQNLKYTYRVFFTPYSAIWDGAEAFLAQRGGATEEKITELPNFGGFKIPRITGPNSKETLLSNTTLWRDSFISAFLPRMGLFEETAANGNFFDTLPKINALKVRALVKIYNEYLRNKEFDEEMPEYKSDTVTQEEFNYYMPQYDENGPINGEFYQMRAKRENSYYTDFRTELQGFEVEYPPEDMAANESLINWMSKFEQLYAEAKSQAENAQENYRDIIAKIRGSKVLTEGKCLLLAKKTFNLNYATITQSTYNNADVPDSYKTMGAQGGYSYTEVTIPLIDNMAYIEDGILTIIATAQASSIFESGIHRSWLNVGALDRYRPDLKEQKHDVLYEIEAGTKKFPAENLYQIKGFKRKWNELFSLENNIQGDLTNTGYFEGALNDDTPIYKYTETVVQPNDSYQFFEESESYYYDETQEIYITKAPWKDYTDLQINKNLATKLPITWNGDVDPISTYIHVTGQNQIDYVGKVIIGACDLPIDDDIKNNRTTWGDH